MDAWLILIALAAVVVGVLVKIGVDGARMLQEERRTLGHVTSYGVFKVGVVVVIVLLILGYLALAFATGGGNPTEGVPGG